MEQFELLEFISGIGVFLFGIDQLEKALKALSSRSMKVMLRKHTTHPLKSILGGTVATAIFTQPEIGTVGLTEEQAREEGPIQVYKTSFRAMMHTISGRDEKMLMKLIVAETSRKVLGCHIVGHAAGEMIQLAGVALKMGATKEDFDRTVAVHPTAAEELVTLRDPVA